jgi:cytochrome c oxidase assembly protein subunit 15
MDRTNNDVWLHRFACALAVATLFLVALGGVVTTKGVGMAVPDWPTTFGHHMFFFPWSNWYAGIFDEHSHRVWASIVGILAAVFAIWAWVRDSKGAQRACGVVAMVAGLSLVGFHTPTMFVIIACLCAVAIAWMIPRASRDERPLRWLGAIMFAAVIIQGVFGGLRVVLDVHGWGTEFGIFHGMLAQIFFVFVCSLVFITSKWWSRANRSELSPSTASRLRMVFVTTTALILLQILFGATMRHLHQGLAVPDLPLAYGEVWPATDPASVANYNAHRLEAAGEEPITAFHIFVHMLHRYTGVLAWLAIAGCVFAAWRHTPKGSFVRKVTVLWFAVASIQVTLGVLSILSQRKVDVTTAHVAVGALTLTLGWITVLAVARLSVPRTATVTANDPVLGTAKLEHA